MCAPALVVADADLQLVGGTIRPGTTLDQAEIVSLTGERHWAGLLTDQPGELVAISEVIIDFTTPESALAHAAACAKVGCCFVSGTTGFDERHSVALAALSSRIAMFHAANFSLGIAAIREALQRLAVTLAAYDVAVIETHHTRKRDAPSGTAVLLAQTVTSARAASGSAPEVDIHSLRLGGQPGEHTVAFAAEDEQVTLSHQAFGRRAYASGALLAARFIVRQPPGRYTMDDLLAEMVEE
jgi:4-hydroxy-tetrahydrodipicolinate reductase